MVMNSMGDNLPSDDLLNEFIKFKNTVKSAEEASISASDSERFLELLSKLDKYLSEGEIHQTQWINSENKWSQNPLQTPV